MDPIEIFSGRARTVSSGSTFTSVIHDDGSLWKFGEFGGEKEPVFLPRLQIEGDPNAAENDVPSANAGKDIRVFDIDGNGVETVFLDGSDSRDDWFISDWKWSWKDSDAEGPIEEVELGKGMYEIVLKITDHLGEVAEDRLIVSVVNEDDFKKWLNLNFSADELSTMGEFVATSDFDGDGYSNRTEWDFGLDPRSFDSRINSELLFEDGRWILVCTPLIPYRSFKYGLWSFTEDGGWRQEEVAPIIANDKVRFEGLEPGKSFRVRIDY
ncbi:MAG: hypothetical protein AAGB46_13300 [Verrucomicrobiota bacterium]